MDPDEESDNDIREINVDKSIEPSLEFDALRESIRESVRPCEQCCEEQSDELANANENREVTSPLDNKNGKRKLPEDPRNLPSTHNADVKEVAAKNTTEIIEAAQRRIDELNKKVTNEPSLKIGDDDQNVEEKPVEKPEVHLEEKKEKLLKSKNNPELTAPLVNKNRKRKLPEDPRNVGSTSKATHSADLQKVTTKNTTSSSDDEERSINDLSSDIMKNLSIKIASDDDNFEEKPVEEAEVHLKENRKFAKKHRKRKLPKNRRNRTSSPKATNSDEEENSISDLDMLKNLSLENIDDDENVEEKPVEKPDVHPEEKSEKLSKSTDNPQLTVPLGKKNRKRKLSENSRNLSSTSKATDNADLEKVTTKIEIICTDEEKSCISDSSIEVLHNQSTESGDQDFEEKPVEKPEMHSEEKREKLSKSTNNPHLTVPLGKKNRKRKLSENRRNSRSTANVTQNADLEKVTTKKETISSDEGKSCISDSSVEVLKNLSMESSDPDCGEKPAEKPEVHLEENREKLSKSKNNSEPTIHPLDKKNRKRKLSENLPSTSKETHDPDLEEVTTKKKTMKKDEEKSGNTESSSDDMMNQSIEIVRDNHNFVGNPEEHLEEKREKSSKLTNNGKPIVPFANKNRKKKLPQNRQESASSSKATHNSDLEESATKNEMKKKDNKKSYKIIKSSKTDVLKNQSIDDTNVNQNMEEHEDHREEEKKIKSCNGKIKKLKPASERRRSSLKLTDIGASLEIVKWRKKLLKETKRKAKESMNEDEHHPEEKNELSTKSTYPVQLNMLNDKKNQRKSLTKRQKPSTSSKAPDDADLEVEPTKNDMMINNTNLLLKTVVTNYAIDNQNAKEKSLKEAKDHPEEWIRKSPKSSHPNQINILNDKKNQRKSITKSPKPSISSKAPDHADLEVEPTKNNMMINNTSLFLKNSFTNYKVDNQNAKEKSLKEAEDQPEEWIQKSPKSSYPNQINMLNDKKNQRKSITKSPKPSTSSKAPYHADLEVEPTKNNMMINNTSLFLKTVFTNYRVDDQNVKKKFLTEAEDHLEEWIRKSPKSSYPNQINMLNDKKNQRKSITKSPKPSTSSKAPDDADLEVEPTKNNMMKNNTSLFLKNVFTNCRVDNQNAKEKSLKEAEDHPEESIQKSPKPSFPVQINILNDIKNQRKSITKSPKPSTSSKAPDDADLKVEPTKNNMIINDTKTKRKSVGKRGISKSSLTPTDLEDKTKQKKNMRNGTKQNLISVSSVNDAIIDAPESVAIENSSNNQNKERKVMREENKESSLKSINHRQPSSVGKLLISTSTMKTIATEGQSNRIKEKFQYPLITSNGKGAIVAPEENVDSGHKRNDIDIGSYEKKIATQKVEQKRDENIVPEKTVAVRDTFTRQSPVISGALRRATRKYSSSSSEVTDSEGSSSVGPDADMDSQSKNKTDVIHQSNLAKQLSTSKPRSVSAEPEAKFSVELNNNEYESKNKLSSESEKINLVKEEAELSSKHLSTMKPRSASAEPDYKTNAEHKNSRYESKHAKNHAEKMAKAFEKFGKVFVKYSERMKQPEKSGDGPIDSTIDVESDEWTSDSCLNSTSSCSSSDCTSSCSCCSESSSDCYSSSSDSPCRCARCRRDSYTEFTEYTLGSSTSSTSSGSDDSSDSSSD